jgi:hypothetical protein
MLLLCMLKRLARITLIVAALQFLACFLYGIVYAVAAAILVRQIHFESVTGQFTSMRPILSSALTFIWDVLTLPLGPLFERPDLPVVFKQIPLWGYLLNALSWGLSASFIYTALETLRDEKRKPVDCSLLGKGKRTNAPSNLAQQPALFLPLKDLIGIALLHFLATFAATIYDIGSSINQLPGTGKSALVARFFQFPLTPTVTPTVRWYQGNLSLSQILVLPLLNSLLCSLFILLVIKAVKISLNKT